MGAEGKQEQAKEETKVVEEKIEEKTEEKKEEENNNAAAEEKKEEEPKPPSPFVLFIDLHCVGCAKKIERSILKIRGVEGVVTNMAKNEVTIKGVVEPQAVCNTIMKRTKRRAKVLSPLPQTEGEPMPQVVASQVSGLSTVELNVNMHCEACAEQLKRKILKMKGVIKAEADFSSSKVTVTGTMDGDNLVEYVYRRTKKQAKIVPQPEPEPEKPPEPEEEKPAPPVEETKPEEKKDDPEKKDPDPGSEEEKKEDETVLQEEEMKMNHHMEEEHYYNMNKMMHNYYQPPLYVMERIPAPQLFSDENPNACSVM